jgi:hypothetical protein
MWLKWGGRGDTLHDAMQLAQVQCHGRVSVGNWLLLSVSVLDYTKGPQPNASLSSRDAAISSTLLSAVL